jgi:hypothetical protein
MGRREPNRAGSASQCPSPCVGLDWQVSQNQTEPFSLRRTCAGERGYHTWCEPCLLGLAMEAKILPKREPSVQHVEGSLKAGRRQLLSPLPASEKSRTSRYFRVGITFPLAFCLDRSTISDESPIDDDGGANRPVLLLYAVVGWTGCRPLKGRPTKSLILSMDDCQSFQP